MNISKERLSLLREAMKTRGCNYFIISTGDPHLEENIPDHWQIIAWLTGFTGSAATVVISEDAALLWTDSRYYIQAGLQLEGSGFSFIHPVQGGKNDFAEWLRENCLKESIIGLDGHLISDRKLRRLEELLAPLKIRFDTGFDPFPELWTDRPALPSGMAMDYPVLYSGKDRVVKINEVRSEMKKINADYQLLTSPADIMWLLNIRGNDARYSPQMSCFALISRDQVILFADEERIPFRLLIEFDKQGIVLLPYEDTEAVLAALPMRSFLIASGGKTSASLFRAVPKRVRIIDLPSIPSRLKAIKNKTEIDNLGKTMIKDGVALSKFFYRFEKELGTVPMSELSLEQMLEHFRAEQDDYAGPSFRSVVAFNGHSALPHYSAVPETDSGIGQKGILLIDSGGQYLTGTTDITRTVSVGNPTLGQIKDFTLVLKGCIDLAKAKIPAGTRGIQIDILARQALWENGLNFGHGTGHGVGYFLNVHEAPPSVSPSETAETRSPVEPGMVFSDEPAVYREAEYGIRTENLLLCYEDEETSFGTFLKFETISLCFIDKKLIDKTLLDSRQIAWLDRYHEVVYEKLTPFLEKEETDWLLEKTSPL